MIGNRFERTIGQEYGIRSQLRLYLVGGQSRCYTLQFASSSSSLYWDAADATLIKVLGEANMQGLSIDLH